MFSSHRLHQARRSLTTQLQLFRLERLLCIAYPLHTTFECFLPLVARCFCSSRKWSLSPPQAISCGLRRRIRWRRTSNRSPAPSAIQTRSCRSRRRFSSLTSSSCTGARCCLLCFSTSGASCSQHLLLATSSFRVTDSNSASRTPVCRLWGLVCARCVSGPRRRCRRPQMSTILKASMCTVITWALFSVL